MIWNRKGYLSMDLQRMLCSRKWLAGIIGIFIAIMSVWAGEDVRDVLTLFEFTMSHRLVILTFIFSALAYGGSICEDYEYKYARLAISRGSVRRYITSKTVVCFLGAMLVMIMGWLLVLLWYSFRVPMVMEAEAGVQASYEAMAGWSQFGSLLLAKRFWLYLFLSAVQFSFLAGMLAVMAMCLSMFIPNKLLIYASPVLIYYYLVNYLEVWFSPPPFLSIYIMFKTTYGNVWNNDWLSFCWAALVALAVAAVLNEVMIRKARGVH